MRTRLQTVNPYSEEHGDFRPRVIAWSLAPEGEQQGFATHECLLTIDSIARLAKPIIVFTGANLVKRTDLYEIIEYGTALGLKVIVELRPEDATEEVLYRYSAFGPKLFRLVIDDCIAEDMDTRYKNSAEFRALQGAVQRLTGAGYEIHLGVTIGHVDVRELSFYHDFAFRSAASGLYCHLAIEDASQREDEDIHQVIEAIARMKRVSPAQMYVSPQCVKYGPRIVADPSEANEDAVPSYPAERSHQCLGGKSFAFIDGEGRVRVCAGLSHVCDNLRSNSYDFKLIWETSEEFQFLRESERSCSDTRSCIEVIQETHSSRTA